LETKLKQTKATKSRQQELEEYEKKYLKEPKTKVSRKTYKVKATRKTAQIKLKPEPKKKSRQQELEEYEKKYLNESETNVSWKAYDVKAKRKVEIQNPKAVKMKNGKWAVKGTSPITGIKVFRIVGNEKPAVSAEKTADSPKAKKEPTAPAEKPKGSQKTEPEVFSRYYRSPEAESPKVKKSKSKKPNLFCEECGSEISADEKFCTNCGTEKPEPETKQEAESVEEQASGGFAFTADGDIGESSTKETAREGLTKKISELETRLKQTKATRKTARIKLKPEPKKKSRQQELEEYEQKYLNESETNVSWKAYDVKAKKKVEIQNPKAVKMKNGKWAVKGTSPITGIKVFRIVGNEKPAVSAEKTADSPKVKKEPAPAEKPKGSQKTEPEVFSRYYRSSEAESPKAEKPKLKKPNPFCEECGSKIAAKDMFCINCGAKR